MSDLTREEVIDTLEMLRNPEPWEPKLSKRAEEALDMAISALSTEGEYIKKEDILNELGDINMDILTDEVKEIVNGLPSYSFPYSENKGEWIEVVEEKFPNGEKRIWHYECSDCGSGEPCCPINKEHWDFCPNCGADMRGEE